MPDELDLTVCRSELTTPALILASRVLRRMVSGSR